jgi:hypothetical protein
MILICSGNDSQIVSQTNNTHAGQSVKQTRQPPKCSQSTQIRLLVLTIRPLIGLNLVQSNLMISLCRHLGRNEFQHDKYPEEVVKQSQL